MWELIKILLFGSNTLLTPQPIDLGGQWTAVTPLRPLAAVTEGAALQIDVSSRIPPTRDFVGQFAQADKLFPVGCAKARLISKNGKVVELRSGGLGFSDAKTVLLLTSEAGVPTDVEFLSIQLRADCEVRSTLIYWKNYSK